MKFPGIILNTFVTAVIIFLSYNFELTTTSKLTPELINKLNGPETDEENLIWIFFKDKGLHTDALLSNPNSFLTGESISRRLMRVKDRKQFDETDLPVYQEYLQQLKNSGLIVKQKSKWFNAVSCYADKFQIQRAAENDFVKKIDLVVKYKKSPEVADYTPDDPFQLEENNLDSIRYGPSQNQSTIINVPPVHGIGYSADGIIIASLDAGFDNLQHNCFTRMRSKGLRTFDFVNGDTNVANGGMGNGAHGTMTLSLVCGYDNGFLISPAFDCRCLLAKTENTDSETPIEEDNWIAAAEWADSLGADIITTSVGYTEFYTWQSMDGNTARITIAADLAVEKGIIVVVSAGNDGYNSQHNTLSAPADGDKVITVGALNPAGLRAGYSSVGPTADGRIKPDLMAMGSNNYTARPLPVGTGYSSSASGTSLACPMVAAVCGLMLSANPYLSPDQVLNILRVTAVSNEPVNNLTGWGTVDAMAAVQLALNPNSNESSPGDYVLQQNYPNPFNPATTLRFILYKEGNISLIIYDTHGKEIQRVINNKFYPVGTSEIEFKNGNISSGVYFYSLIVNGNKIDTKKMVFTK